MSWKFSDFAKKALYSITYDNYFMKIKIRTFIFIYKILVHVQNPTDSY